MHRKKHISFKFNDKIFEFDLDADRPVAVIETDDYEEWIDSVVDIRTNARITKDVSKLQRGLFGDWKEVDGVFEMRLDYGPGYRVYYAKCFNVVVILLGGGDKSDQRADLKKARRLWKELKNAIKEV